MANIIRPYLQRGYAPRYGSYQSPIQRGMSVGQQLGTDVGSLIQAFYQAKQNQRMNDVANQLMNTPSNYDPVSDVVNQEGLSDQFQTTPEVGAMAPGATGGVAEYNLRQRFQQNQLANQLRQAQITRELNLAQGGAAEQGLTPYQQLQEQHFQQQQEQKRQAAIQKQRAANADSLPKLQKEFESLYGKGSASIFYNAAQSGTGGRFNIVNGQVQPDPNGQYFTPDNAVQTDQAGKPVTDSTGATQMKLPSQIRRIPYTDLQNYMNRVAAVRAGGGAAAGAADTGTADTDIDTELQSETAPQADTTATDTSGADTSDTDTTNTDTSGDTTQANLPQPTTIADYNAIPVGSLFIDGDGLTKRKYTV